MSKLTRDWFHFQMVMVVFLVKLFFERKFFFVLQNIMPCKVCFFCMICLIWFTSNPSIFHLPVIFWYHHQNLTVCSKRNKLSHFICKRIKKKFFNMVSVSQETLWNAFFNKNIMLLFEQQMNFFFFCSIQPVVSSVDIDGQLSHHWWPIGRLSQELILTAAAVDVCWTLILICFTVLADLIFQFKLHWIL